MPAPPTTRPPDAPSRRTAAPRSFTFVLTLEIELAPKGAGGMDKDGLVPLLVQEIEAVLGNEVATAAEHGYSSAKLRLARRYKGEP